MKKFFFEFLTNKHPKSKIKFLAMVCNEYMVNANDKIEAENEDFYKNPLEWINKNTPYKTHQTFQ